MNKDITTCTLTLQKFWPELKAWYEDKFPNRELVIGNDGCQRTPIKQLTLFCQGRLPTVPGDIVAYKDGFVCKSKHNALPLSKAVDLWVKVNGKVVWEPEYYFPFSQFIQLNYKGVLRWGGVFKDFCHVEEI